MSRDYEQDLARCDERTQKVAVALASGAEIEAKYYAAEAEVAVEAADAHDQANGIHRIVIDDATVERAARALARETFSSDTRWDDLDRESHDWILHTIHTVLAAAVKEEQA